MSLIGPRPCPNCGGMVPEGGMLAHICRRPSSSDSEALRLLRELADVVRDNLPYLENLILLHGHESVLLREHPAPCQGHDFCLMRQAQRGSDAIRITLARADKDNAGEQVTGNSSPNSSSMENRLDLPAPAAPAAPAEAPTPETDALMEDLHLQHEHELLDGGEVFKRVEDHARRLERQRDAALERERLAKKNHALALGDLDDANERERLANMLADQADEARIAADLCAKRAAKLRARQTRPQFEDRSDEASFLQDEIRNAIRSYAASLPAAPVASTSEREGKDG